MKPIQWGPFIWYLIHSVAYYSNDEYFQSNNNIYFLFYNSLRKLIPCPICRSHFNKLMNNNDIYNCKTSNELIQWTINKHNNVNKRLHKTRLTRDKVDNIYKNIDLNKVIKGIDIIIFNIQYKLHLTEYIVFLNTLKKIFPEERIRLKMCKAIDNNKVRLRKQSDIIKWYIDIGNYIRSH